MTTKPFASAASIAEPSAPMISDTTTDAAQSGTPRTDAEEFDVGITDSTMRKMQAKVVSGYFARTLERESRALAERVAALEAADACQFCQSPNINVQRTHTVCGNCGAETTNELQSCYALIDQFRAAPQPQAVAQGAAARVIGLNYGSAARIDILDGAPVELGTELFLAPPPSPDFRAGVERAARAITPIIEQLNKQSKSGPHRRMLKDMASGARTAQVEIESLAQLPAHWNDLAPGGGVAEEVCPNCDTALPKGCSGTFKDQPECRLHTALPRGKGL